MARNLIAITSLLIAIALTSYMLFKATLLTTSYIIGFAISIFFAFMSGYTITRLESMDFAGMTAQYKQRMNKLKEEYERGKASAPNPT
jgi:hypothetical protein